MTREKRELEALNEEIEKNKTKLEETTSAYKELQDTVSNYQSALDGLKGLEAGTIEFYNAIVKANEEAEKLIERFNFVIGQDYTINADGKIVINDDALKSAMMKEQQKVFRDSAILNNLRGQKAQKELDNIVKQYTKVVNEKTENKGFGITQNQGRKILSGDSNGKINQKDFVITNQEKFNRYVMEQNKKQANNAPD